MSTHYEEPITKDGFLEYINYLQSVSILSFQLTLTKRLSPAATNYEMFRFFCDNFRPIISSIDANIPEAKFAARTPCKPSTPKTWSDIKDAT